MSSALDTLLEAARYIELQEQRGSLSISPSHTSASSTLSGRYQNQQQHHNYYDNNSTNTINNSNNNNNNNIGVNSNITRNNNSRLQQQQHHNQVSSPPLSPGFNLTNDRTNNNHHQVIINNNHEFSSSSDYGSTVLVPNSRSIEGRVEQPYINNGHSNTLHSTTNSMNTTTSNLNTNCGNSNPTGSNLYNRSFYNNNYKINNNFSTLSPSNISSLSKNTVNHNGTNNKKSQMKFVPLTPPPMSSRKIIESTRIRSISLSSNKITANTGVVGNGSAAAPSSSLGPGTSSIVSNNSSVHNVLVAATTEDSSQSSLNLSSSGYLSGSSVNSSIGCGSNLNLNTSMGPVGIILQSNSDHQIPIQPQSTSGRRRTTSTNSNGTQRSPSILRAGTREVHNKLEKHRRAHLKECFEQLKVQLQLKDEEKKKTSNLAILGAAYRHVISLRRKERELEQQVEQLAKEKINAQKKIVSLKRELSAKYDNIDFSTIISDGDLCTIPADRVIETPCDSVSLSSGKGSIRYSSSSSLSSGATISSPLGAGMTSGVPLTMSPVISSSSSNISPSLTNVKTTSSIINNAMPLSLTTKHTHLNCNNSMLPRDSPTPSTPSPSPSSSGISSSSPIISSSSSSSSPPIGIKIQNNLPNGIKISNGHSPSNNHISIVTSSANNMSTSLENGIIIPTTTNLHTTLNGGIPLNFNSSQNMQLSHTINSTNKNFIPKDLSGKNGISRKNQLSDKTRDLSALSSRVLLGNGSSGINNNNTIGCGKDMKIEDSEHPTKVIKLINGAIALAPVNKDNKLLSSTPLSLSQVVTGGGLVVSPFPMLSSQGLRVIGPNGLATIELSSSSLQSQSRNHNQQTSTQSLTSVTPSTGAQLHKLLVNGGTTIGSSSSLNNCNPIFTTTHGINSAASELARLPGGAELNILPTCANGAHTLYRGNGKLAIVNNNGGIATLKGSDPTNNSNRAVHVVTPMQSGNSPMSGLTPIVVSQGQPGSNLAHIIASSPQLAGKVNLSVGGQTLISTQYLSSMKPMVVAVANNSNPTLTSVPPNQTSSTIATGKLNGIATDANICHKKTSPAKIAVRFISLFKKIVSLKRELSAKYDNIDFSTIISDGDLCTIPADRVIETPCDSVSLSSGKGSIRYSSSSSLSSGATISSPLGAGMTSGVPLTMSPVISSSSSNISPSLTNVKTTSSIINNAMPLSLTTKHTHLNCNNSMLPRDSPTPSTPSPSPSSSGISSSSPIISSSSSSSSPPIGIKIQNNLPNGIKISNGHSPSNNHISIVTSSANNMSTSLENGIIIPTTTNLHTTLNGGIPLNFNSSQNMQLSHTINSTNKNFIPKDLSGKNGISRKNQLSDKTRDLSALSSRVLLGNGSSGINNNNTIGCGKDMKIEDSEHPTKVIKLINGAIALAPVNKDNKLLSSTPLSLSQVVTGGGLVVSPFPMLSSQGLRVIGPNGLATIELSSSSLQSQSRNHNQQTSTQSLTSVTPSTGAQLHKLLVNGGTTIGSSSSLNNCNPIFTTTHGINSAASELARLPGGAELNILPTCANGAHTLYRGNGKLAIVNNNGGIATLKGSDPTNNSNRAVHVVTPMQSGNSPMSGLTPIVVSQGQPGSNLAHIIASSPQLAGKVNLSVGGQTLISTQYLSSMKPMVVAVANNSNPTLTSVPPNQTSSTIATGKLNGSN